MSHEKVARAIIREVPIKSIAELLKGMQDPTAPLANGNGCGSGCGAGCLEAEGLYFDKYGHSEIPQADLVEAVKDIEGLRRALKTEIDKSF